MAVETEGSHTIFARARDRAGNETEVTVTFQVSVANSLFRATYNASADADEAVGDPTEKSGAKITSGGNGHEGEGLKNTSNGHNAAEYESAGNIDPTRGMVCMWVKPLFTKAAIGKEDTGRCVFFVGKSSQGEEPARLSLRLAVYESTGTTFTIFAGDGSVVMANADAGDECTRWYASKEWTHVAVSWDATAGSVKIYVNGDLIADRAVDPWQPSAPDRFVIAGSWEKKTGLNGIVDEVEVYDVQLRELSVGRLRETGMSWR
jgi:hypothetical protein